MDVRSLVGQKVRDVVRELTIATVRHTGGNIRQACRILGLSHDAVHRGLNRYRDQGFDVPAKLPRGGSNKKPRRLE